MKAEALSRYPCIQMSDGNILCSADNGDGTFSPVVLNGQNIEEKSIYVGEPIEAVALIPFWIVKPVEGMERLNIHVLADISYRREMVLQ